MDCSIGRLVDAQKRLFCRGCGFALPLHKWGCVLGLSPREDNDMGITAGGAEPDKTDTGTNPGLKINPDVAQPTSVENTFTPQAQADAAQIDRAYDGR